MKNIKLNKDKLNDYKRYNEHIKSSIEHTNNVCDNVIEQLLFYKYLINSTYDYDELIDSTVAENLTIIIKDLELILDCISVDKLHEVIDYSEEVDITLSWKDFKKMKITKKLLREMKIYNLTKD